MLLEQPSITFLLSNYLSPSYQLFKQLLHSTQPALPSNLPICFTFHLFIQAICIFIYEHTYLAVTSFFIFKKTSPQIIPIFILVLFVIWFLSSLYSHFSKTYFSYASNVRLYQVLLSGSTYPKLPSAHLHLFHIVVLGYHKHIFPALITEALQFPMSLPCQGRKV